MKKKDVDPRINVKTMNFRSYATLFLMILFVCDSYLLVYIAIQDSETIYTVLSIFTYMILVSVLLVLLFDVLRKHYFQPPMQRLCEAARKVAQGDYSVRITPLRRDGKKDEFEVLFEDFNAMTEELASTEMLKKDFVSNVSHELKTPLSVIQNYAVILQNEALTEEDRVDYAKKIGDASNRLSVLITNTLQISQLENQKILVKSKRFNLSEQICRCILSFEQMWEEKGIELETDLDQSIVIYGDEDLLDIVWNNLIANALKFTDYSGTVRVTAKKDRDSVIVTVEDTGYGISPDAMRRIFDKFYQMPPT